MFQVAYETTVGGRSGIMRVAGGIWNGDACVFEFADTATGLAGSVLCDWRDATPRIDVLEGDPSHPSAEAILGKLRELLAPFHRGSYADIDDASLAALYAGDYHTSQNYAVGSATETAFKRHVIDQLVKYGDPGKVLDAGCSAGEVVRQLRERGIDAWGFDLCADLDRIAYPETRPFLRRGSVDQIPFGPADGFSTLLALDVFEHIPERSIRPMVEEFLRLGVRRIVAHIALVEFHYVGHITLRPLSWWDRQLAPWFQRTAVSGWADAVAGFRGDPSNFLRVYELAAVPAAV
jgi:hypothetical protein